MLTQLRQWQELVVGGHAPNLRVAIHGALSIRRPVETVSHRLRHNISRVSRLMDTWPRDVNCGYLTCLTLQRVGLQPGQCDVLGLVGVWPVQPGGYAPGMVL